MDFQITKLKKRRRVWPYFQHIFGSLCFPACTLFRGILKRPFIDVFGLWQLMMPIVCALYFRWDQNCLQHIDKISLLHCSQSQQVDHFPTWWQLQIFQMPLLIDIFAAISFQLVRTFIDIYSMKTKHIHHQYISFKQIECLLL